MFRDESRRSNIFPLGILRISYFIVVLALISSSRITSNASAVSRNVLGNTTKIFPSAPSTSFNNLGVASTIPLRAGLVLASRNKSIISPTSITSYVGLGSSNSSIIAFTSSIVVTPTVDPCNTSECQANSTCINMGNNNKTCRCNNGYYLRSGYCRDILMAYEAKIKISSMKYDVGLSNRYSRTFMEKASIMEVELLPVIQDVVPNVIAIKVTGFQNGSLIVHFRVILDETIPVYNNTEFMIKQAITGNANLSQLTFDIDSSFDPVVTNYDKCVSNITNDCHQYATCSSSRGIYTCKCKDGFVGNGSYCEDINECLGKNNCHRNATCTNTNGSYYCTCNMNDGGVDFEGNGTFCKNMDKCASSDTNDCHQYANCNSTGRNYTCECKTGFNGTGTYCEDINECLTEDICHPNATCTNAIGSYYCTCIKNYDGDGRRYCRELCPSRTCVDVSEICVKQNASWVCQCKPGSYKGPSDKHCFVIRQELKADDMSTGVLIGIVLGVVAIIALVTIAVTFIHYVPKI